MKADDFFTERDQRVFCKFCDWESRRNVAKMSFHISTCEKVSENIRINFEMALINQENCGNDTSWNSESVDSNEVNVSDLCRLCGKLSRDKCSIFGEVGLGKSLPKRISAYLPNIKVEENDKFPQEICCHCVNTVASWHEFFVNCSRVNENFQRMIKKHSIFDFNVLNSSRSKNDYDYETSDNEWALPCNVSMSNDDEAGDSKMVQMKRKRRRKSYASKSDSGKTNDILTEREKEFLSKFKSVGVDSKGKTIYKCDQCPLTTTLLNPGPRFSMFDRHYQNKHNTVREIKCDHCAAYFRTKFQIYGHMKRMHLGGYARKYSCTLCDKTFTVKSNLAKHQSVHTVERNFICHICGNAYKNQQYLSLHCQRVHPTGDPFLCHLCTASFKNKKYLEQHLRVKKHNVEPEYEKRNSENQYDKHNSKTDYEVVSSTIF